MGEDKGFDYLKALHKNVNQYTKSGAAPAKATALGETHDRHHLHARHRDDGGRQGAGRRSSRPARARATRSAPCRIIKGAQNMDNAKKFYDWALTRRAQKLGAEAKSYQVPSNKARRFRRRRPKLSDIKLINYDFAKYGSSAERKRLLTKWDDEVKNLPK